MTWAMSESIGIQGSGAFGSAVFWVMRSFERARRSFVLGAPEVLKGHDFSRDAEGKWKLRLLAAEGWF
jgi:hypothetical protein